MAKHSVLFNLNKMELGDGDSTFIFRRDNGIFGTLVISKRQIKWFHKNSKKPKAFTWQAFDKVMKKSKEA